MIAYGAVAFAVLAAGAGTVVALNHPSGTPSALGGSAARSSPSGQDGTGRTSPVTRLRDASAVAAKVNPGIVDIDTNLRDDQVKAAGTGMVISASGLVLTNNHVIDEATSLSATLVTSGRLYPVRVVGYDSTDDVALLQLVGASGLTTVPLSDSGKAKVGQAVLALGNADGKGGLPLTAQGTIKALDQSVAVSYGDAGTTEQLHGMIETDAPLQPGDSGGPLVNGDGAVVGMDTAANSSGLGRGSTAANGFAIPVNAALSIANQISSGNASTTVHIGLAGFMGVNVADASSKNPCAIGSDGFGGLGSGLSSPVSSGALVCVAYPFGPASQAGLETSDVIVSVNGKAVGSAGDLTALTAAARPGEQFAIEYVDHDGTRHSTTVTLTGWAR